MYTEALGRCISMNPLYIDGLLHNCSNSSALAIELLQSYTKPSMYT